MLAALAGRLRADGETVVATREPGGTPLGDALRAVFVAPGLAIDPRAEALLVSASRAQHVAHVIAPALASGAWVLCDRFTHATLAYQGWGRGLERALLDALAAIATAGVRPDVTFVVDVPVGVSRERVAARARATGGGADRLERADDAFHERVRAGYLALAEADPRLVVLDGTLPPERVADDAWAALEASLAKR